MIQPGAKQNKSGFATSLTQSTHAMSQSQLICWFVRGTFCVQQRSDLWTINWSLKEQNDIKTFTIRIAAQPDDLCPKILLKRSICRIVATNWCKIASRRKKKTTSFLWIDWRFGCLYTHTPVSWLFFSSFNKLWYIVHIVLTIKSVQLDVLVWKCGIWAPSHYFECNGSIVYQRTCLWDYHTLTGNEMCVQVNIWVSPTSSTLRLVTNQSMRYIRHFFLLFWVKMFICLVMITRTLVSSVSVYGTLRPVHWQLIVQVISEMTDGGVDYSFECTGINNVLREAFLSTHDVSCAFLFLPFSCLSFIANTVANWPTNIIAQHIIWPS
jgi:hypothetical protein